MIASLASASVPVGGAVAEAVAAAAAAFDAVVEDARLASICRRTLSTSSGLNIASAIVQPMLAASHSRCHGGSSARGGDAGGAGGTAGIAQWRGGSRGRRRRLHLASVLFYPVRLGSDEQDEPLAHFDARMTTATATATTASASRARVAPRRAAHAAVASRRRRAAHAAVASRRRRARATPSSAASAPRADDDARFVPSEEKKEDADSPAPRAPSRRATTLAVLLAGAAASSTLGGVLPAGAAETAPSSPPPPPLPRGVPRDMGPGVVALDLVPGKAGGLFAESGDEVRRVLTLVTIRPRSRGERRSLRTLPGASLRPHLAFNPDTPRRLSTPTDAFPLHPDFALYGMALRVLLKGRLFAKQGWIFTNDYAETDDRGLPRPHVFTLGAGEVIDGLDVGCLGLREGGVRRVVASPPASYRDKAR